MNESSQAAPISQEDFLARVQKEPGGCWIWTGRRSAAGYGYLWRVRRYLLAHRVSYELHVGPVPPGVDVDHLCSNPSCCNPHHLEPVTHAENQRRMAERGRSVRGERHPHVVLAEAEVLAVAERLDAGESKRTLSREFGVTWTAIHCIDRGLSWQWLTGRSKPPRFRHPSVEMTADVNRMLGGGRSSAEIAAELRLAPSTISRIKNRRTARAREAVATRGEPF